MAEKSDRGTDRIWRHLSNLEEQMTRRHGETDERITLIESQTKSDSGLDSDDVIIEDSSESHSQSSPVKKRPDLTKYWTELGALKAKVSEIIGRDILDIKKSLNTSAQRAEVRRLAVDIENIKMEFAKPLEEKINYLQEELQKRKKVEKVRLAAPVMEVVSGPGTGSVKNSITKDDMAEFEEKLERFKDYWIEESEKYAKLNLLEMLTGDMERIRHQVTDLADAEKRDIQSMENKLEHFAEDIEKSVTKGRASDRQYVDERLKTFQSHGISGAALEDIATLQHNISKINGQLEMLKDTDASLTETISKASHVPEISQESETETQETETDTKSESTLIDESITMTISEPVQAEPEKQELPTAKHGLSENEILKIVEDQIAPIWTKVNNFVIPEPAENHDGLLRLLKERMSRLEDEIACCRKDEQNNFEQLKRQLYNLKDDFENRKPKFIEIAQKKSEPEVKPESVDSLLSQRLEILEKEREGLERQILSLITKMDAKVDTIDGKCSFLTNEQLSLEEQVAQLGDRISESNHGVQSISTPSIPPAFFDVSPEIFDERIELLETKVPVKLEIIICLILFLTKLIECKFSVTFFKNKIEILSGDSIL